MTRGSKLPFPCPSLVTIRPLLVIEIRSNFPSPFKSPTASAGAKAESLWYNNFCTLKSIKSFSECTYSVPILLVISVLLAWLTYKFIEKPIRFAWRFRYKTWVLVGGMLCVGVVGYFTHKADGYPERTVINKLQVVHEGDIGHDVFHEYHRSHFSTCVDPVLKKDAGHWKGVVRCFQSRPEGPVTLLLLGDSHAEHLFLGIAEQLPEVNVGFYGKGALPFLSKDEFKYIFEHVLNNADVQQVVISAMWAKIGRAHV